MHLKRKPFVSRTPPCLLARGRGIASVLRLSYVYRTRMLLYAKVAGLQRLRECLLSEISIDKEIVAPILAILLRVEGPADRLCNAVAVAAVVSARGYALYPRQTIHRRHGYCTSRARGYALYLLAHNINAVCSSVGKAVWRPGVSAELMYDDGDIVCKP